MTPTKLYCGDGNVSPHVMLIAIGLIDIGGTRRTDGQTDRWGAALNAPPEGRIWTMGAG